MRFQHLSSLIYNTPLAIRAETLEEVHRQFQAHLLASPAAFHGEEDDYEDDERPPPLWEITPRGVVRLRIYGILGRHLDWLAMACGGCDVAEIGKHLPDIMARRPRAMVLDIRSPGGSVAGVPELFQQLRAIGQEIPLLAYSEDEMCSGGYYLGSAAQEIHASPSAVVGSIGVIVKLLDDTEAMKQRGLSREVITTGPHKSTGTGPLSDAQRAQLTETVGKMFADFRAAIATRPGAAAIPEEAFGGQWWPAAHAPAGIVDGTEFLTCESFIAAVEAQLG